MLLGTGALLVVTLLKTIHGNDTGPATLSPQRELVRRNGHLLYDQSSPHGFPCFDSYKTLRATPPPKKVSPPQYLILISIRTLPLQKCKYIQDDWLKVFRMTP